jgi:phage terminase small subunit
MGIHGRKTAAEKAASLRVIAQMELPKPPKHLSKEAAREWIEIVATYPPDRFPRATWAMLEGYCVHAVQARKIAAMLDKVTEETSVREYNLLLMMHDRESKSVASFGVRLGIARTSMSGRHNADPDTLREEKLPWEE